MGVKLENIFYPDDAVRDQQRLLLDVYLEDYGEENRKLIQKRQNKTTCLFDSDPVVTKLFVEENAPFLHDPQLERRTEKEYEDYIRIAKKYLPKVQERYYQLLNEIFRLPGSKDYKDVLGLDFDSYSFANNQLLKQEDLPQEIKDHILARREAYFQACHSVGVRFVDNPKEIKALMEARGYFTKDGIEFLMKKTKWGKRIQNSFYQKGIDITLTTLSRTMAGNQSAYCFPCYVKREKRVGILIYFPIIKNKEYRCFDRFFYHENRHAVEYGKDYCGLSTLNSKKYNMSNEIRTEMNAKRDCQRMKDHILFSNDSIPSRNYMMVYEKFFPYTGFFFRDHLDFLNQLAICGRIDLLEDAFGEEALADMDAFLKWLPRKKVLSERYDFDSMLRGREHAKKLIKK